MWRIVRDAATDANGGLYVSGDCEGPDAVWALGPDLTTARWKMEPPLHSASLAWSPAGELVLWNESNHQAVRVSCANGERVGAVLGKTGAPLDFHGSESVGLDAQGNLVLIGNDKLRRFTLDGVEVPAWPGPSGPGSSDKPFWELGDRPEAFETDHALAQTGWDGSFYLLGWNGPLHVARYDASGKRVAKAKIPFARAYPRGRPWADRQGRVYLFAEIGDSSEAELSKLAVLRLSADFKTIERLVEATKRRAELAEKLAVGPDGTLFIAGPKGGLHVFSSDGAPLHTTQPATPPAFATGSTAGRGEAISSLSRRLKRNERDDDVEPDTLELFLFVGSAILTPFAFFYLAQLLFGHRPDGVAMVGLFAGFVGAPAVSGWFGVRRSLWFRVPMAGRWLCGVVSLLMLGVAFVYAGGLDPLGLNGDDDASKRAASPPAAAPPGAHTAAPAKAPPSKPVKH